MNKRRFNIFRAGITPLLLLGITFSSLSFSQPAQAAAPAPDLELRPQAQEASPLVLGKEIEGGVTTADVGDVIRYRLRFQCSSLTQPCGEIEITDVLDPGLIYLPPPNSSVPGGFSINYDSPTRTVTITKDDNNMLDGSQYDAVIAVQVDYDLRPLPATINNTVGGRMDPGTGWVTSTSKNAPPITIGVAADPPEWELVKTLYSPRINPTVNTDVTYSVQLRPISNEGNTPIENVVITDTLPAGATYVSASDGGTESGGVVTWPTIAGPIYPPSRVTRYVSVRYNDPPFIVGNNVTNTVSANGEYTDNDNILIGPIGIATGDIPHPIDPIAEEPSYSKGDVGDPIGISGGLGRFILNLNTNATNYPSDDLILIDNLPPELEVTSVTSGSWGQDFEHVRAFVEYSTDYGASYTAFSGQPISYNTNTAYAAPADNITNVRWRFEYDPDGEAPFNFTQSGLPYTWSFSGSPEIRVTPRSTATTADDGPPATVMPAATAGSTYTNCLQVSRTNSSGNPVTDPCANEDMTVESDFVSLRVSKNETPGASWDEWEDPNINTFTADSNLLPGDTLRYVISMVVTERSSAPLIDPTILDTLPDDLIFVRNGTARLDGVALVTQPTFTESGPNPGVSHELLWEFSGLSVNPEPASKSHLDRRIFRAHSAWSSSGYTHE